MTTERTTLIAGLEEAFRSRSWHGTNLLGSIRGMRPDAATWRPGPGRHNCWELVVHCAYWKYAVTRRLTGEKRGSFPLSGSNWFRRSGGPPAALRQDVRLLVACHEALLAAAGALPARKLRWHPGNGRFTAAELLRGAAAHDLYHAGQIQLIKRLHAGG